MTCGYLPSRIRMRPAVPVAAVLCLFLMIAQAALAQHVSANASVRISAVVHGSLSVNARAVPLSFDLFAQGGEKNYAAFPLAVTWNLNPAEVQGFQVIGYFANPDAALVDGESGAVVPSSHVLGRLDGGQFRPFAGATEVGPVGGSLTLLQQPVVYGDSRGTRTGLLEMRLDRENLPELPKGNYEGMLFIEVRHY